VLCAFPGLVFSYDIQPSVGPAISAQEGAKEKVTFDHHQAIYNDKANSQLRAKEVVAKDVDAEQIEKKKVEDAQDRTKGQVLLKF